MSGYINNNTNSYNKTSLPEQSGLYGVVTSSIGITQYIAYFIINKITSILGIDTSGKDLHNLLDEIYKVLEDPVTRKKFLLVMGSITEILVILVDELSGPLKQATLQFIDLGEEASVKLAKTFVAASIDALGVVPGVGEVVEGVKFFDDITKQIQASINVFIKTVTLLTNLLGANLDSFNNIRTRIQGSVEQIKSQFQDIGIPSLPSLPSFDNLQNNITNSISDVQGRLNTGITNAVPSFTPPPSLPPPVMPPALPSFTPPALPSFTPPAVPSFTPPAVPSFTPPPPPAFQSSMPSFTPRPYQQKGGIKNINKNINKTAKRIVKNLHMFYNRKINKTHRIRKQ
jgi:hypothetical protein